MRVLVFRVELRHVLFMMILVLLAVSVSVELVVPAVQQVVGVASGRRVPIYRVDTADKEVAISFDATWGTDLTDEILQILKDHGVTTTFFLAGFWVDKYPQYVIKIAEHGHEIGNHSYSHPHMNALTFDGVVRELQKNHAMIQDLTGQSPFLFRPPFGEYNNTVIEAAESAGYFTIQWSIDSLDWRNASSAEVYERVMERIGPGEIVLFHNAAQPTPDALRQMIPKLQRDGYTIVPISQLIHRENYVVDHDGTQRLRGERGVQ